jgi:hypothetical protein
VIIDKTHRRWCLVTLVALVALTAAYVLYVRQSINGPSGGSRPGLWFGVLAAGLMLYAFALAIRRRFPSNAGLGSGQFWLRGHLWLGALTLPVALFHSGFRFGGPLEQWLMGMFLVVILTGLYGVVVQQLIPRLMRLEVPQETFLYQVGHLANRQRLLCDREVAKACGPLAVDADPLVVSLHHLFDRLSATTTREEREAWLGHVAGEHKNLLAGVARVAKDNNWQIRRDGKVSGLRQLSDLPFAFPLVYDWPATEPAAAPATTPAAAGKPAVAAAAPPTGAQPAGAKSAGAKPAATPAATGPVPEASPGSAASPAKLGSRPGAATPAKPPAGAKALAAAGSDPVTTPTGTKGSQSAGVAVADDEEECADASQSTTFDVLEMLRELKQTAEIRLSGEFPALSFEDEFEAPGLDAPPLIVESIKPVSVPPPDVPQAAKGASSGQAPAAAKPTGAKPSPAEMLAAARAKQAGAAAPATPAAEAPAAPAAKPAGGKPSAAEMLAAARAKQAGATAPATPAAEAPAAPAAKPAGGKPSPAEMLAAAKARQAGGAASPAPAAKPSPAEMLAKAGQGAAGAAPAATPPVPKKPATASAPPAPAPIPEHRLAALKEFYLTQVRPYLGGPGKAGSELGNADASRALFSRQRAEFPATLHPQLLELEAACDETRQLRRARQLHRWLHGWLAIHIPASVAVIVLLVLHIVLALRVNPFSF